MVVSYADRAKKAQSAAASPPSSSPPIFTSASSATPTSSATLSTAPSSPPPTHLTDVVAANPTKDLAAKALSIVAAHTAPPPNVWSIRKEQMASHRLTHSSRIPAEQDSNVKHVSVLANGTTNSHTRPTLLPSIPSPSDPWPAVGVSPKHDLESSAELESASSRTNPKSKWPSTNSRGIAPVSSHAEALEPRAPSNTTATNHAALSDPWPAVGILPKHDGEPSADLESVNSRKNSKAKWAPTNPRDSVQTQVPNTSHASNGTASQHDDDPFVVRVRPNIQALRSNAIDAWPDVGKASSKDESSAEPEAGTSKKSEKTRWVPIPPEELQAAADAAAAQRNSQSRSRKLSHAPPPRHNNNQNSIAPSNSHSRIHSASHSQTPSRNPSVPSSPRLNLARGRRLPPVDHDAPLPVSAPPPPLVTNRSSRAPSPHSQSALLSHRHSPYEDFLPGNVGAMAYPPYVPSVVVANGLTMYHHSALLPPVIPQTQYISPSHSHPHSPMGGTHLPIYAGSYHSSRSVSPSHQGLGGQERRDRTFVGSENVAGSRQRSPPRPHLHQEGDTRTVRAKSIVSFGSIQVEPHEEAQSGEPNSTLVASEPGSEGRRTFVIGVGNETRVRAKSRAGDSSEVRVGGVLVPSEDDGGIYGGFSSEEGKWKFGVGDLGDVQNENGPPPASGEVSEGTGDDGMRPFTGRPLGEMGSEDAWAVRDYGYGFGARKHAAEGHEKLERVEKDITDTIPGDKEGHGDPTTETQSEQAKTEGTEFSPGKARRLGPGNGHERGSGHGHSFPGRRGRGMNHNGYGNGRGTYGRRGGFHHHPHQHQPYQHPPNRAYQGYQPPPPHDPRQSPFSITPPPHFQPLLPLGGEGGYYPPPRQQMPGYVGSGGGYEVYPQVHQVHAVAPMHPLPPVPPLQTLQTPVVVPPVPTPVSPLSFPLDPTRWYLLGQLEYYLSSQNMAQDFFLRQRMDAQGWIPISLIASFNRVRQLTMDVQLVRDVLELSSVVQVREDWVRMGDWEKFVLPDAPVSEVEGEVIGEHALAQMQGEREYGDEVWDAKTTGAERQTNADRHNAHPEVAVDEGEEGDIGDGEGQPEPEEDEDEEEDVVFVMGEEAGLWTPEHT